MSRNPACRKNYSLVVCSKKIVGEILLFGSSLQGLTTEDTESTERELFTIQQREGDARLEGKVTTEDTDRKGAWMQSPGEWGGETTNLLQASLREFRFFSANPAFAGSSMPPNQSVSRHAPFFPSVLIRAI